MDMELSHSRESDLYFLENEHKSQCRYIHQKVHLPESLEVLSERSCMEGVMSQVSVLRH